MFFLLQISANYLFAKPLVSLPSRGSPNKNLWLLQKDPSEVFTKYTYKNLPIRDKNTLEACLTPNPFNIENEYYEYDDIRSNQYKPIYITRALIENENRDLDKPNFPKWIVTREYDANRPLGQIGYLEFNGEQWSKAKPVGRLVALQSVTAANNNLIDWLKVRVHDKNTDKPLNANTYTGNGCRLWRYTDWQGYRLDKGGKHLKIFAQKLKTNVLFSHF